MPVLKHVLSIAVRLLALPFVLLLSLLFLVWLAAISLGLIVRKYVLLLRGRRLEEP